MDDDTLLMPPGVLAGLGGADTEPRSRLFDRSMRYVDSCPKIELRPARPRRRCSTTGASTSGCCSRRSASCGRRRLGWASASCRAVQQLAGRLLERHPGPHRADRPAQLPRRRRGRRRARPLPRPGVPRCVRLSGAVRRPAARPPRLRSDLGPRASRPTCRSCLHLVVRLGDANPAGRWYGSRVEDVIDAPEVNAGGLLFNFTIGGTLQLIPAHHLDDRRRRVRPAPGPEGRVRRVRCRLGGLPMDRLDEKYELLRLDPAAGDATERLHPPQRLVRGRAEPSARSPASSISSGPDRIMWGSDFPHVDSSMARAGADPPIRRRPRPTDRRRVLGGNARRLRPRPAPPRARRPTLTTLSHRYPPGADDDRQRHHHQPVRRPRDLGFDPDALREKYRHERDKRLRPDGEAQYIEVDGRVRPLRRRRPLRAPGFDAASRSPTRSRWSSSAAGSAAC